MRKILLLCSMLLSGFIAGAQCSASFSAVHSPVGNQLRRVQFNNTSSWGLPFTGQIRYAKIYYGDGNNAIIGTSSPAHAYNTPGTYTVSLAIMSIDSASSTVICQDSIAQVITVVDTPCGTTMNISGSGLSRSFFAFTPAGSSGMSYSWNFGDGSPTATGQFVSHTYAASGVYAVTLTATKSGGCTYTNVQNVGVYTPPPPLNCANLKTSFNTSVSSNVVTTTNTSNTVNSPYKMDITWRYGDGTTSNSFNPVPHAYTAPGMYVVSLKIVWHDSLYTTTCTDSSARVIAITSVPPPPNVISGRITYDSTLGTNFFKVWLYRLDTVSNLLTAVDSVITGNTSFVFYSFANKPAGSYRTRAAVHLGSTSGNGVYPTYHDSSSYWNTASVINHTRGSSTNKNIYMRSGLVGTGPGVIGGNVSLGANKGTATGVSGMLIFLRNATLRVVRSTYTDANGNYEFSNIPTGNYSVYPEHINFSTMPITPIAITAANPEKHDANFNQDLSKRTIAPRGSLNVPGSVSAATISVAPNPAAGFVTISWKGMSAAGSQFLITSMTGTTVARTPLIKGQEGSIKLDISTLAQGVYIVQGTGDLSGTVTRLIVR